MSKISSLSLSFFKLSFPKHNFPSHIPPCATCQGLFISLQYRLSSLSICRASSLSKLPLLTIPNIAKIAMSPQESEQSLPLQRIHSQSGPRSPSPSVRPQAVVNSYQFGLSQRQPLPKGQTRPPTRTKSKAQAHPIVRVFHRHLGAWVLGLLGSGPFRGSIRIKEPHASPTRWVQGA